MTKIFKILDFAFRPVFFEAQKGKFKEDSILFSKALSSLEEKLNIETRLAFDGVPRIEWSVADGLGRNFRVSEMRAGNLDGFACSSCLSFERTLALLLEKTKGILPFWLSPLQVKGVFLQKEHRTAVEKVILSLKEAGFRAELFEGNENLKTVLHQAVEEGVPYVVVMGDKELETGSITLRDVRAKNAQSLQLQELIEMLKKVN